MRRPLSMQGKRMRWLARPTVVVRRPRVGDKKNSVYASYTYTDTSGIPRQIAGSNLRCNRLLHDTDFKCKYPDYRQGYKQLTKDYGNSD